MTATVPPRTEGPAADPPVPGDVPHADLWTSRPVTLLLAVASGVCLWAAFPDVGAWPLALVSVALLLAALRRDTGRAAGWNALVGFVAMLTFWLPHIWWANFATDTVPWLALAGLQASFGALLGAAWTAARRLPGLRTPGSGTGWAVARAGAFALVLVAVEQLRSEAPFGGFPWGRLAWTVVDAPTGRSAWLGGSVLASLLVAFAGALGALAVGRVVLARRSRRIPGAAARATTSAGILVVAAAAVVVAPALLPLPSDPRATPVATAELDSTVVDAGTATHEADGPVLVAGAVQGNVTEPGLGSFANRAEVLNNHLDGTAVLASRPEDLDVVLWPENGSDLDPQEAPEVAAALDDAAEAVGAPILVGAQEFPETGGRYNVSLLWRAGQGVTDRYAKQHPAPFGEYIPLRGFVRIFSDQVDRVSTDMLPGVEPAVVDLPRDDGSVVPLATVICFEVAYDEIVRDAVARGAQVLVVPTNNASFGYTAESTQQLAMTRMQAIATGRAAVQISTVGVSGIVAPDGTLLAGTGLFTADQMVAALPLRTTLTPAVQAGYWPGWIISTLGAGLTLAGLVTAVRERRTRRGER
ncbi:apolipoprotein N-acyltransferase [Isoptericola halotolerans]|uniref:Apolipoprotein N-acyltransferase n=1 Tax=Isoptericola halotolerans TaxID=300560 RepID=A0ABX2A5Z8_9MICO|nr:apolipoprotein N-acyltransferase [Isoptericola halotolerans]NOV98064.1 apolipoprotein N-acyltransferase [Isoptericola halotolerans]